VKVHFLTIFPELFGGPLATGPIRIAREKSALDVAVHDLRDYTTDKHLVVDDVPYGGGQGMLMKPEPLVAAIEHIAATEVAPWRILLAARGRRFDQTHAAALAARPSLLFVCGRYEGVDERVVPFVDEELSIGDYVLSGGELAALVVLDAVVRLLPGVLGNEASPVDDSFATGLLEGPQYTRPATFRDAQVPDVLLSGDHAAIARWRREQALRTTLARRPDLLDAAPLDDADVRFLRTLGWTGRPKAGEDG
jgi:tRNA (guanine37-N1)-methyltransferase